ncbi:hypothetical protein P3T23_000059 [Paraburkholderia sp. GAS448]
MPCARARPGIAPECVPFTTGNARNVRAPASSGWPCAKKHSGFSSSARCWFLWASRRRPCGGCPVAAAMFYLAIDYRLGPPGIDLLRLDIAADAHLLRTITEIALLVSLFAIGLRLRLGVLVRNSRHRFVLLPGVRARIWRCCRRHALGAACIGRCRGVGGDPWCLGHGVDELVWADAQQRKLAAHGPPANLYLLDRLRALRCGGAIECGKNR